jgi:ribosomal protein S18 acetylase RimI-like enzyme
MTAPSHKRQGIARAGMQQAIAALAARGATQVQLIVTRANTPAVRLYGSLGFRVDGQGAPTAPSTPEG